MVEHNIDAGSLHSNSSRTANPIPQLKKLNYNSGDGEWQKHR